ncbi:MAG: ectoine synthase [Bacteroidota bacterium]
MIIVKHKSDLLNTERAVETDDYSTVRLLLKKDGAGLTVTDVMIKGQSDSIYGYKHHKEICYCLEGEATLVDLENGIEHTIKPGSLWAATNHEKFRFIAHKPTRLISIFDPALVGPETNDEEGSFPLLSDG